MKMKFFAALCCAVLMTTVGIADEPKSTTCKCACPCSSSVDKGIVAAVDLYIEGGRKGDSKITRKAFAPNATMSWSEKGKSVTVPIQALYDYVDKSGAQAVTRGEIKVGARTATTAIVSVDTQFGAVKFTDMFALVRDGDDWKIVAKVYHVK
jgi:hypothetical protein